MMNQFIESLRRLCVDGKVKEERIVKLFEEGKISLEEKLYILAR